MANRTIPSRRAAVATHSRWPAALLLATLAWPACAADRHEVVVTPSAANPASFSAINEDGIVEANTARVQDGVVYLEFRPQGAVEPALTAAAH